jgi:hypothetical protein
MYYTKLITVFELLQLGKSNLRKRPRTLYCKLRTIPPSLFPSIPPPIVHVPVASHTAQFLTEEVQRETQGVLSNNKFQPHAAWTRARA